MEESIQRKLLKKKLTKQDGKAVAILMQNQLIILLFLMGWDLGTVVKASIKGNEINIFLNQKSSSKTNSDFPFLSDQLKYQFKGRKIRQKEGIRQDYFFKGHFPVDVAFYILRFLDYRKYLIRDKEPSTLLISPMTGKCFSSSLSNNFTYLCEKYGNIKLNPHYVRSMIASSDFGNGSNTHREILLWHVKLRDIKMQSSYNYLEYNRLLNKAMNELAKYRYMERKKHNLLVPAEVINNDELIDWKKFFLEQKEENEKLKSKLLSLNSPETDNDEDLNFLQ